MVDPAPKASDTSVEYTEGSNTGLYSLTGSTMMITVPIAVCGSEPLSLHMTVMLYWVAPES